MKITLDFLSSRGACLGARDIFLDTFGTEAELNKENIRKYIKVEKYAFQDFMWLGRELLDSDKYEKLKWEYYKDRTDTNLVSYKIGMKLKELLECT